MAPDPHRPASLAAFVRAEGRGVVATVSPDGAPEAALVGLTARDDGTLIFDSPETFRKIANLRADDRVAVVIGTGGDVSVQVEGTALVVEGEERVALAAEYETRFPGSRALTDGFAVVAVRPAWVRVYDASSPAPEVAEARWNA
ncbi:pyridoxamine 5'-phosphate oxidase family protein [Microbacterium sp.]|uniref:pyridoxamine 5'-phosphate oxidase family protein n=1 Tax=Microbacterium sp. TaxID=51671 RepID=UPI003341C2F1